ncbi:permease prefix domain 1-containing protein [Paenibacillus segetis]|uniref:Uncharacterized protein n=1 Tax=Paenibacillus segetis TaxID=1325360 RepID=A0ABQ1YAE5_9BACL|nr:permease prefix domain 1-containing protein [Paenibacillus segetis]GGH18355.1 hypothetical protein GCM10008013_14270 [Paenibacillus segetis]
MNELQMYVDRLFRRHKNNKQTNDLKAEILSNLEAKVADLTSGGMEYKQAVKVATENIDSVDFLLDHGNKKIYFTRYLTELLQIALLYCLIAWIVTIPLRIIGEGIVLNGVLFIIFIIVGALFLIFRFIKANRFVNMTFTCDQDAIKRNRNLIWFIWILFITVWTLGNVAIDFGSNIWYSHQIKIGGPYQFAVLAIRYALPFVSVIIPMLFQASVKLIAKYEVGSQDED